MNHIEELFSEYFEPGHFKLIDLKHPLSLYIGSDDEGHPAIEYSGAFKPVPIRAAGVIEVAQYKRDGKYSIAFILLDSSMLSTFCAFCEDLVESTRVAEDDSNGYKLLLNRFYGWKKMFRPNKDLLRETEIMGLIGELTYLKEDLIPICGKSKALIGWTGSGKTRKDFSLDTTWVEIKTINAGKETVKISSYEQLESEVNGHLVVFELEKMSPEYDGVTIKKLVHQILEILEIDELKDLFLQKVADGGYAFETEYDNYVFDIVSKTSYLVTSEFPCLRRTPEFDAIAQVKYDLLLSKIESYKE